MGVTLEHLLETIRRRKVYRLARFYRKRSRRRALQVNPLARVQEKDTTALRAGEGDLHGYLRQFDMSLRTFSDLTGISYSVCRAWAGHPLHRWPIEFLRMYGWATAMAKKLKDMGIDPAQFEPKLEGRRIRTGQYPRRKGDLVLHNEAYSPYTEKQ